jgi:hypothetical protein
MQFREVEGMQTQQAIIENRSNIGQISTARAAGSGWLTKLFGCWHTEMSRPFSNDGQTYRVCLGCGARRQFNLGRWEMQGDFYYGAPSRKHFRGRVSSVRRVSRLSLIPKCAAQPAR